MAVTLTINVGGIDDVLVSFNAIQIKRSITGVNGVYNLITANSPAAATLTAPNPGNYPVVSKTLQLRVDHGAQVDIIFTGTDPLTTAQVVDQINTAMGATVAADVANVLVLTSTNTGTGSVVEVVGGGAAPIFGFIDGQRDIGEDIHITLQAGVSGYTFIDQDGQAGYYYKAQFLNTATGLTSAESTPFEGDVGTLVSSGTLSTVKVDLVDGRGIALPNQVITFYSQYELLEVEGFQIGLNREPISITTNNSGHAEIALVRGSRWRVAFEGTSIIRDITIPDTAETDLLAALGGAPDPFDIATLPFPSAPRRTL
jgi:hypothetical protein